jgi:hypothetical protein
MHNLINSCSAPCSSGKTRSIVHLACELAGRGERALIIQNTTDLIDRTIDLELKDKWQRYEAFHGGTVDGSVAAAITKYS